MMLYTLNNTVGRVGDFSLTIAACELETGRIYSVVGANGSGKTTLLETTVARLKDDYRCAVIEGDVATDYESSRSRVIREAGVAVAQYTLGLSYFQVYRSRAERR